MYNTFVLRPPINLDSTGMRACEITKVPTGLTSSTNMHIPTATCNFAAMNDG